MIQGHDADHRDSWERTRWMALQFLSPHLKKNAKMKGTDLIRFPWEDDKEPVKARKSLIERARENKDFFARFDKLKADGKIVVLDKKSV